ncbi:MAG TPA: ORF6N domain-containing protein [Pyrinomonadaceae bacterium]|nr:ORF6N domain-containing protein [Pyrinomonadaceae bacterium]
MPHKKKLTTTSLSVSVQLIERRIYLIRGQKVMIDFDLAELYGVPTKRLNERVSRSKKRFPEDFMFRLTKEEAENLRSQFATSRSDLTSQFVTSSTEHGGRRYLPYAFTEQGVAMLSSVLNSEQAIEVNIAIIRAFVRLRQMLETNEELNRKFAAVIRKLSTHDKYFRVVFDELKKLTEKPPKSGRQIGFKGQ